jgi:beta-1,4-N-acetylglucosaminyltransferase
MRVLVTVGSTEFDALVRGVLQPPVLAALRAKGYTDVAIQCGAGTLARALAREPEPWTLTRAGVRIALFAFKPALDADVRAADLVISHAGACADRTWAGAER